ncbi:hypothetical protein [Longimicrobium sp.]|uniref:hypothetical protein n=1 Tax=Longimicrobium sp. TaxID=2029185 RepID=UPI002E325CAF|nr:hypothetical protein [Longimicrobium sp.]HEX6042680.1 hypothetical protein [Longimicrobium sp.]
MTHRSIALAVLACASLAACERAGQSLPFDSASQEPVTRTVPASGGTVSSAAGASVELPAGAVPAGTAVTLTPTAAQPSASGTVVSPYAFQIEPAGLALQSPAAVDLRLNGGAADAWLASVVVSTPAGVVENGDASVDLNTGLLHGKISTLGTVSAVVPDPAAVLRARPLGSTLAASATPAPRAAAVGATRALRGDCGRPGKRCSGLVVEVSERLLNLVDTAAVLYPQVAGQITINGQTASGSLVLVSPLRVRLGARTTATTIPSQITATATPQTLVWEADGRITLSNVRVVGRSGQEQGETMATLTVEYQGAQAWIRLQHQFEAVVETGNREMVTVAAQVPLDRVQ